MTRLVLYTLLQHRVLSAGIDIYDICVSDVRLAGNSMFRDASIDTFIHFHDPINMYARVEETEPVIVKKLDHQ